MKTKEFIAGYTTCPYKFLELGEKAREAGFKNIDGTMPYPVHGFEESYGFKSSWIGIAAFIALLVGWGAGIAMQTFIMSVDYPIIIGGKPHIPWPSFIPVIFECGILFAALTTLISLLIAGKLRPNPITPIMKESLTDDVFSILIPFEGEDEKSKAEGFLKDQEVDDIEIYDTTILDPRTLEIK